MELYLINLNGKNHQVWGSCVAQAIGKVPGIYKGARLLVFGHGAWRVTRNNLIRPAVLEDISEVIAPTFTEIIEGFELARKA